jgi:hypothetical protein
MIMKNDPWIDRVYQSRFASHQVPMSEEAWAQMQGLLDAEKKKKDRRMVLVWLLTTSILLGGGFLFYHKKVDSKIDSSLPKQLESLPKINPEPGVALHNRSESAGLRPSNDLDESNNKIKAVPNKVSQQQVAVASQKTNTRDFSDYDEKKHYPGLAIKTNQETTSGLNPEDEALELKMTVDEIAFLPIKQEEIGYDTDENLPIGLFILKPTANRMSSGRESGFRLFFNQRANAIQATPSIDQLGGEFYAHKAISKHLFLTGGLGYSSHFNKSEYAQIITEYQYTGFSAQERIFGVRPEWLQTISAQLQAGIEIKKNRFIAGFRPEALVSSRGEINQLAFAQAPKSLANASVEQVSKGWLESQLLNRFSLMGQLAYEYRIRDRIGIGIQFNRTLRSSFRPLGNEWGSIQTARWNSGFRISYILK